MKKADLKTLILAYKELRQFLVNEEMEFTEPSSSSFTIDIPKDRDTKEILMDICNVVGQYVNSTDAMKMNVMENRIYIQFKGNL